MYLKRFMEKNVNLMIFYSLNRSIIKMITDMTTLIPVIITTYNINNHYVV